jgi:hypothetical protein
MIVAAGGSDGAFEIAKGSSGLQTIHHSEVLLTICIFELRLTAPTLPSEYQVLWCK